MKIAYKAVGILSLALGVIGAFLPLLPTTCFVLLSAWCFAKSSPRWHQKMRDNRYFGRIIKSWEDHRVIPENARKIAIGSMLVSGAISWVFLPSLSLKLVLLSALIIGILTIEQFRQARVQE